MKCSKPRGASRMMVTARGGWQGWWGWGGGEDDGGGGDGDVIAIHPGPFPS